MARDGYRYALVNYVLSKRYRASTTSYALLFAVADVVLAKVIASARTRTCPYCGKRFCRMGTLKRHLTNGRGCSLCFRAELEEAIRLWAELRRSIVRYNSTVRVRGLGLQFRSNRELAEWIRENGLPPLLKST